LDFSRLRNGEIVAAVGGLALFIFMFFHWFGGGVEISTSGTQNVPGVGEVPNAPSVEETGVSGWDALADFSGFLIALAAVSGVGLGGLAASGQRLNLGGVPRGAGTAALGSLAVLLIVWRFFANPGDLKIGIFLGLAAAIAVAVGALMALREDGFEPLVKVPGGRTTEAPTTVVSARAPAATPTPRPATAPGGSSSGGSRSGKSTAAKSRSSGGAAKKSRSGGSKSSARKATGKKKSTASRSKSSSSSRSKGGGSSRSKSSASSRAKSSGTRSRSKSSGSRARSKSSGTRRRASGGRK
jgi:hypothetical protein